MSCCRHVVSCVQVVLIVGVAVASLAACGAARNPTKRTCVGEECFNPGAEPTSFCSRDSDCAADQYCSGGTCAPRNGTRPDQACLSHNDCAVGTLCNVVTGRCVECLNDDHCDLGLSCRADGTCGEESRCSSNFDCGGLVCDTASGNCVQCNTSADCPLGQTCRDHACFVDGGGNPPCQTQADCDQYGRICNPTSHECVPCTGDLECGTGRVCANGTCTTAGGGTGNGSCTSRADCAGQACFMNACVPCISDFMCFELNDLVTGVTKICAIDTGLCTDPECNTANDCAAGEACYDGHCGACLYDDECRAGEVCNPNTGVCGTSGGTPGCTSNAGCTGGQVCVSGTCQNCTSSSQCTSPQTCNAGRCTTGTTPGAGAFGASCVAPADCQTGLTCLGDGTSGICTRTCIGSGKGGDADCPLGYGCIDYVSGALDGLSMCNAAAQMSSTYPGLPFDQAPGASCADHNGCQTSVCYSDTHTCARACLANRDCNAGEVCYSLIDEDGAAMGYDLCFDSDTSAYKAAGVACAQNWECDSGLCVGTCANGSPCNGSADCGGQACTGTCRDHCRSNSDCPSSQSCNPWATVIATPKSGWVATCMPKFFTGTQADGTSCTEDANCASDWCIGGICTTPCAIKADCTGALANKQCKPITFVDQSDNPVYALGFCL